MTSTVADHHHDEVPKGITRWLFTTNHKDIGTLYLWFAFIMFLVGGAMSLIIRTELFQPGLQIVNPHFFNQMTTVHALVMVFGAVMPGFVMVMKIMTTAQKIVMNLANVTPVMYLTVLMMIAVQRAGLVMALKTVKIRRMAVTSPAMIMMVVTVVVLMVVLLVVTAMVDT